MSGQVTHHSYRERRNTYDIVTKAIKKLILLSLNCDNQFIQSRSSLRVKIGLYFEIINNFSSIKSLQTGRLSHYQYKNNISPGMITIIRDL